MEEVSVKTHLIITNIRDEYTMNWCGRLLDVNPKVKNGKPVFTIIGSLGRSEINTIDIRQLEECAKRLTYPRGRQAISIDKAYIYIQKENGGEQLFGILTHKHIKEYAPMFDKFGWKE